MIRQKGDQEPRDWTALVVWMCLAVYVGFMLFLVYGTVTSR